MKKFENPSCVISLFLFSSISSASHKNISNLSAQRVPRHKLTFEEFENHTEDAWDASEDELLRNALAKIKVGSSCAQVE